MSFSRFQLHTSLLEAIDARGFVQPTPIQKQAIPPALAGKDVLGLAATGTGKTAAFMVPLLNRLMCQPESERGTLRALVVGPTRELVAQIYNEARMLGRHSRLRFATVYGGVGMHAQTLQLRAGVDVLFACPGRLLDHVRRGHADLSQVDVLVLDEADMMFDMGFLTDVREILRLTRQRSQTMLFSATMPQPLRELAEESMTRPVTLEADKQAVASTVDHYLCPVSQHLKTPLLKYVVRQFANQSMLVFVRTRHGARRLWQQLSKSGIAATCLQGNLSQGRRQAALDGFRRGTFRVMVATDIAARGIDVSQVGYVINYDFPPSVEACVHRAGRTGRADHSGVALTFVTEEDEPLVRTLERVLDDRLERWWIEGFDYTALQRTPSARPAKLRREPRPPRVQRARKQMEDAAREQMAAARKVAPHAGQVPEGQPDPNAAKPAFRIVPKDAPAPLKPRPGQYVMNPELLAPQRKRRGNS
ncbi:DEAD/DEAH box helicase [Oleidesulfovibrio sp.]|uniref:DEAD/DEAH box helicase n=1 Tax=Oleidesulfovibrio sp. TaxID=2909707 RepID=UPI003A894E6A